MRDGVSSRNCGLYLGASAVKLYVAEHHARLFDDVRSRLSPTTEWEFIDPPPRNLLDAYAHADGCVVQLVASFDAWACAAAWALGHGDPDGSSFAKLAGAPPAAVRTPVSAVAATDEWADLLARRHTAAHRGLIGSRRSLSSDRPGELLIKTEGNEEVIEVLNGLCSWARPALTKLHHFADAEGWRSEEFEKAPHRL